MKKIQFDVKGLTGIELVAAEALNKAFGEMPELMSPEDYKKEIKGLFGNLITDEGKLSVDADMFKKLADQLNEKTEGSLKNILMKQGEIINKLQEKQVTGNFNVKSIAQILYGMKDKLTTYRKEHTGGEEFHLKAVTSIASSTSVPVVPANPYFPLPDDTGIFVDIQLPKLFILDYIDKGETTSASLLWTEQGASVWGAAIVSEGAVKPFTTKQAIRRVSQYFKIAAVITLTEELEKDIPKLATNFKRLFTDEILRTQHNRIISDIIAIAPGYVSVTMNGLIKDPDFYGAIAAAVSQIENLNFEPDFLAVNPSDFWTMNQNKDSLGHYNIPPFVEIDMGEMRFAQLRLIVNPAIAAGSFMVGDAKTYKVDEYEGYTMRVGFINDDFARNQSSIVGEVKYHSYIATNHINAWVYAQYATIQSAIAIAPAA